MVQPGIGERNSTASKRGKRKAADDSRQRVRFVSVERSTTGAETTAAVVLEWQGVRYVGECTGTNAEAIELRTSALATIDALRKLTDGECDYWVAGFRRLRAFDAELLIAGLVSNTDPKRTLVGAVIITDDIHRAAALAVLSAVNRVLGNYIATV